MTRSGVGHLLLAAQLDGRAIDVVLDTGAGKTIVEIGYCRAEGIPMIDTGDPGAPAVGAGAVTGSNVHMVEGVALTLDGMSLKTDGLFAIDMTHTNQKLTSKGIDPIRAVIGQDVLRYHEAVIDYAALTLFLKENP